MEIVLGCLGVAVASVAAVALVLRHRRQVELENHRALGLVVDLAWVKQHHAEFPVVTWWGAASTVELWLLRPAGAAGSPEERAVRADPKDETAILQFLVDAGTEFAEVVTLPEENRPPRVSDLSQRARGSLG